MRPNSPWLSAAFAAGIIYQHGPYTIGLVYRLPVNILQLTVRSAPSGYIRNKLFLRKLRRLTDRWCARRLLSPASYRSRQSSCSILCASLPIFLSPFSSSLHSLPLFSLPVLRETCSPLSTRNSHRDYSKATFISAAEILRSCMSPDFEVLRECGGNLRALAPVLNPHHEIVKLRPRHVAPFECRISLGNAIDGPPSSLAS